MCQSCYFSEVLRTVSYESIRTWANKFGPAYAHALKRRSPRRGDKWHLDEVRLVIQGKVYWLWRAVDQDGYELDILLQTRRNAKCAVRFFKKLLKGLAYMPRVIITDKLASYRKAKKACLKTIEHRAHKGLNNRAENSHQPTRQREKQMRKFKSVQHAQRFLAIFGQVRNLFFVGRYKTAATEYRQQLNHAFQQWDEITLQVQSA
jgi:putative transposase